MLEVKVLPKDKCLAIAKVVGHTGDDDDELLAYLPDEVFGNTFDVDYCAEDFNCYAFEDRSKGHWAIPTYFCESVYLKVNHQ